MQIRIQLAPTSNAMMAHIRQLLDFKVDTTKLTAVQTDEQLAHDSHSSCIQLRNRRYIPMQRFPSTVYPDRQPHLDAVLSSQNCSQF